MTHSTPEPDLTDEEPQGRRSGTAAAADTAHQLAFLIEHLPPAPARILDAGCGAGTTALALAAKGYAVTAIDNDPGAVEAARRNGIRALAADMASYEDEDRPFDAVLFSLSLHHMDRLEDVLARAQALLHPTGVLVIDEFGWERADGPTAAWFDDAAALLGSANLLRSPAHGPPTGDPLVRWISRHQGEAMHTGDAMIGAVGAMFEVCVLDRVPYLHRYLSGLLTDETTEAIHTTLRDLEARGIADGRLQRLGMRLVARHTPERRRLGYQLPVREPR